MRRDLLLWPVAGLSFAYVVFQALAHTQTDFWAIWAAMHAFVRGGSPYPATWVDGWWAHPPGAALVQAPAGILPLAVAARVWVLLSAVAVAAGIWLVHARAETRRLLPVSFAIAAVSLPLAFAFELSNAEPICVGLLALGIYLLAGDRPYASAAAIGVAVTLKPTMAPLVLLPALVRRPRASALAIGIPVLANGLAFLVVPHADRFVTEVIPYLRRVEPTFDVNTTAAGAAKLLHLGLPGEVALEAVVVALLGYVWWTNRSRFAASIPASTTLLVLLGALASSYFTRSYTLYFVLALPLLVAAGRPLELLLGGCGLYLLASPQTLRSANASLDRLLQLRWFVGYLAVLGLTVLLVRRQAPAEEAAPAEEPAATVLVHA